MRTLSILAIGNSFTQDPLRYLHEMAKKRGVSLKIVNLVIGGCSLERHYRNMLSGEKEYAFEFNGEPTGFRISLSEALASDKFDVVTLQQASHYSFDYRTYQPYLHELLSFVRRYQPAARIALQNTWAYEEGSTRLHTYGFETENAMFEAVCDAYARAAADEGIDTVIPSAAAMHHAASVGAKVHRDTFHADLGFGRYMLSLVWLGTLCDLDPLEDTFDAFDVTVPDDLVALARQSAHVALYLTA